MGDTDHLRELVGAYAEAASAHGQATLAGDSKRANQAHDVIAATYHRLRTQGEQRRLLPLLSHEDPAVVAWVGAHALEFAPVEGEHALTTLAERDDSVIGLDAEMTLAEWRRGKLTFP